MWAPLRSIAFHKQSSIPLFLCFSTFRWSSPSHQLKSKTDPLHDIIHGCVFTVLAQELHTSEMGKGGWGFYISSDWFNTYIKIHWVMWCLVGGHSCSSVLPKISHNYLYSSAGLYLNILLSLVKNTEDLFQQCMHHQVIKTDQLGKHT